MLGIDIHHETLRIVLLQERGKGFILRQAIEVPLDTEERNNPVLLGRKLEATFQREEWKSRRAFFTLQEAPGLIKRLPDELLRPLPIQHPSEHISKTDLEDLLRKAQQSMLLPTEDMVFDLWFGSGPVLEPKWNTPSSVICAVLGAMPKSAVEFCRQTANETSIRAMGLTMRSLAKINSLWFHWSQSPEFPLAVVFVENDLTDIAILDTAGLVSLQSIQTPRMEDGTLDAKSFGREIQRILNVSQLSSNFPMPGRFYLGGTIPEESLHAISEGIGNFLRNTTLLVCGQPNDLSISPGLGDFEHNRKFLAAIGASLEGHSVSPVGFNFLHPRGMRKEKKKPMSWRPLVFAIAAILLGLTLYWFMLIQNRKVYLHSIDSQYNESEPILAGMVEAQKNWNLVQSFISVNKDGTRQEYLKILYEITRLFPDTKDAYLTDLTIYGPGRSGGIGEADIVITGKVRQGEVLTEFIDRLNGSEMIRQAERAGSLMQEPGDTLYPFIFSVTCNLRQPLGTSTR